MTASADLREAMTDRIAELRAIPADPVERARLRAERAREITGPQHQIVTCWRCLRDLDIADARPEYGDFRCVNEEDCTDRTGEAEDAEFIYAARGRGDNGGI